MTYFCTGCALACIGLYYQYKPHKKASASYSVEACAQVRPALEREGSTLFSRGNSSIQRCDLTRRQLMFWNKVSLHNSLWGCNANANTTSNTHTDKRACTHTHTRTHIYEYTLINIWQKQTYNCMCIDVHSYYTSYSLPTTSVCHLRRCWSRQGRCRSTGKCFSSWLSLLLA